MLKLYKLKTLGFAEAPAAFGRLCVETTTGMGTAALTYQPPSGGCVLKQVFDIEDVAPKNPAAFRRLCVETKFISGMGVHDGTSRLQAAVC